MRAARVRQRPSEHARGPQGPRHGVLRTGARLGAACEARCARHERCLTARPLLCACARRTETASWTHAQGGFLDPGPRSACCWGETRAIALGPPSSEAWASSCHAARPRPEHIRLYLICCFLLMTELTEIQHLVSKFETPPTRELRHS